MAEPLTYVQQPRKPPVPKWSPDENFDWITSAEPHKSLSGTVRRIVNWDQARLWQNTRYMSLYLNQDLIQQNSMRQGPNRGAMPRQTQNLIRVYTDTLAGKLVQSNSKIDVLTSAGDWTTHRLAKKLDWALEAEFRRARLYEEVSKVCIDAINTGTGYLHVFEDDSKVCYERWFPNEVFVDPLDAAYGKPSMIFRTRFIKRETAMALWGTTPELRDIIAKAALARPPMFGWTMYQSGMIELFEGWALEQGSRKGRHVLCLTSGTIVDERWNSKRFPVAVFKASEPAFGWYGEGFVRDAGAAQVQLNIVLDIMAKAAKLGIAPYWVVAGSANISLKQLNNSEGHVVTSDGPEPKWMTNKPFHESAVQYAEYLRNAVSIIYGINEIESSGAPGFNRVDSDPALTNLQDAWMARHTIVLKNWSEAFFLDIAERTIDTGKEIAKKRGSYPVMGTRGHKTMALDWAEFTELTKEDYRIQMSPANSLSITAASKRKEVMEMMTAGLIDARRAWQLLQGPADLEYATAEITAMDDAIDKVIEGLANGDNPPVSQLLDPQQAIPRVRAAALQAEVAGAPDEILMDFENWIADATARLAPPPPPMPAGGLGAADGTIPPGVTSTAIGPPGASPIGPPSPGPSPI